MEIPRIWKLTHLINNSTIKLHGFTFAGGGGGFRIKAELLGGVMSYLGILKNITWEYGFMWNCYKKGGYFHGYVYFCIYKVSRINVRFITNLKGVSNW